LVLRPDQGICPDQGSGEITAVPGCLPLFPASCGRSTGGTGADASRQHPSHSRVWLRRPTYNVWNRSGPGRRAMALVFWAVGVGRLAIAMPGLGSIKCRRREHSDQGRGVARSWMAEA